jgi:hypothetical protein
MKSDKRIRTGMIVTLFGLSGLLIGLALTPSPSQAMPFCGQKVCSTVNGMCFNTNIYSNCKQYFPGWCESSWC